MVGMCVLCGVLDLECADGSIHSLHFVGAFQSIMLRDTQPSCNQRHGGIPNVTYRSLVLSTFVYCYLEIVKIRIKVTCDWVAYWLQCWLPLTSA